MERVRQDQFDFGQISDIGGIFEHIQNHSLDGRLSPDRHKNRSRQSDSVERYLSDSRISFLLEYLEVEFIHRFIAKLKRMNL